MGRSIEDQNATGALCACGLHAPSSTQWISQNEPLPDILCPYAGILETDQTYRPRTPLYARHEFCLTHLWLRYEVPYPLACPGHIWWTFIPG